tara:strand:- start:3212 stop:4204 length:993 start_codon:yes stop_codon:yes gene_type:complete
VSSQGFFNFGDNFDEQISGRFAGEKDNSDDQIASSLSSGGYGGYIDAGSRRGYVSPEQADKMLKNPETYKMRPSETRYLRESMGLPRASLSVGEVKVASADLERKEKFDGYLNKFYGFDTDSRTWKNMGGTGRRILNDSFNDDSIKYKEGSLLNRAKPKEEKGNILQRIAGSIFDAATGTQPAAADVLDGKIDFGSAVRGIGNLPSDYKATEAAAFRAAEKFRDTASGMSNLPSNYKATEAAAFRAASNFKEAQSIAKRNPNVSINSDGKAVATNNSARARAQASAVNRKLSGKSISQTKSENKKSMRDAARKRHAAFKKKRAQKKNKKN